MSVKDAEFWNNETEYHPFAKQYEKNVKVVHPESVTSRRMCPCLKYSYWCGHPLNGKVSYYEYRGPQI